MREEKLLRLFGDVDQTYIEEASIIKPKPAHRSKWIAAAACLVLCVFGVLAGYINRPDNTQVSYICFDVNPSFELCLNAENTVIDVIAYNDDGEALIGQLDYHNRHYKDVINSILHLDGFQKHLTEDLTITIVSSNSADIQQNVRQCLENVQCAGRVICSDPQTREQAYNNHCSVGKYVAYTELVQYDATVTLEDCKDMNMHELYAQIQQHHDSHHGDPDSTDCTGGNSHSDHSSGHHSGHH